MDVESGAISRAELLAITNCSLPSRIRINPQVLFATRWARSRPEGTVS